MKPGSYFLCTDLANDNHSSFCSHLDRGKISSLSCHSELQKIKGAESFFSSNKTTVPSGKRTVFKAAGGRPIPDSRLFCRAHAVWKWVGVVFANTDGFDHIVEIMAAGFRPSPPRV